MISVIIPTYNRASCIARAANSVLSQTYKDIELIIVDDGSTDETKEIIASIVDPRIKYIFQENKGACSARNTGIEAAKGEYVAFQDSDDYWYPTKLEEQLAVAEKENADIVICQMRRVEPNGNTMTVPNMTKTGKIPAQELQFGTSTQTIFTKRCVVEEIKFNNDMPRFQDLEWLIRALRKYSLFGIKKELVEYQVLPDSISSSPEKLVKATQYLLKEYPSFETEYPIVFNSLCKYICYESDKYLRLDKGLFYELESIKLKISPGKWKTLKRILLKLHLLDKVYLTKRRK